MVLSLVHKGLCAALSVALLATANAVDSAGLAGSDANPADGTDRGNAVVLANRILDRWQGVAEETGAISTIWREQHLIPLALMELPTLVELDRLDPQGKSSAKARYARFIEGFQSAVMQSVMLAAKGKSQLKLGSNTVDQIFIPIPPCRIVDTRNVGGPIAAGTQRAFN